MCGLEVQIAKSGLNAEPSRTEAVLILLFTFLVQIAEAFRTVGWLSRATGSFDNLDNSNYLALADFIRNWTPTTSFAYQHSWGYPYFIIAVSSIFHVTSLIRIVGNPSDAQAMGVKGTRTQDWFKRPQAEIVKSDRLLRDIKNGGRRFAQVVSSPQCPIDWA
jgi:hypothetical protein